MQDELLLRCYLEALQDCCECQQVSLYVPAKQFTQEQALLFHLNQKSCVAEFSSIQSAVELFEGHQQSLEKIFSLPAAGCVLVSQTEHSVLLGLSQQQIDEEISANQSLPQQPRRKPLDLKETDVVWLGLKFSDRKSQQQKFGSFSGQPKSLNETNKQVALLCRILVKSLAKLLVEQQLLHDPQTFLVGRQSLQQRIESSFAQGRQPLLFLVNPHEFNQINTRFDRDAGDQVMQQFAARLSQKFRQTDTVARYGGATFAILVEDLSLDVAHTLATNLHHQLTRDPYLDGAVALEVHIGLACLPLDESSDAKDATQRLLLRAEQALNSAKQQSADGIVSWQHDGDLNYWQGIDRLGGIFTAEPQIDYRNMLLLWDLVGIIGTESELKSLLSKFMLRLYDTFKPGRLAVIICSAHGHWQLIEGLVGDKHGQQPPEQQLFELQTPPTQQINELVEKNQQAHLQLFEWQDQHQIQKCLLLPMISADKLRGILLFESELQNWSFNSSDQRFLHALAHQLGAGILRLRMQTKILKDEQAERLKLEKEVKSLRASLGESRIVYRSEVMEQLIKRIHRVAATSATVLITGESGTGKELLAETLHKFGPRNHKPMVIVDCSAIPESLIESELFGHVKGAFTGAVQVNRGRIVEAEGGTLILDEIGELPVSVQAKFLRFVQEKEVTAVGGNSTQKVDVNIVAVTNRDLLKEVEEGRFREDLYYRLNVVLLKTPALRERRDDIPLLIQHFNRKFARQFHKAEKRIDQHLCHQLQSYRWPGNVRELQNRMMQAVILCESDHLLFSDFELGPELAESSYNELPVAKAARENEQSTTTSAVKPSTSAFDVSLPNHWLMLERALDPLIEQFMDTSSGVAFPLGAWLQADFVLAAYERVGGVARSAARLLGASASTARRKLLKANRLPPRRPAIWEPVRQQVHNIVASSRSSDNEDILKRSETILLRRLQQLLPDDTSRASELMGVCEATFKRRQSSEID